MKTTLAIFRQKNPYPTIMLMISLTETPRFQNTVLSLYARKENRAFHLTRARASANRSSIFRNGLPEILYLPGWCLLFFCVLIMIFALYPLNKSVFYVMTWANNFHLTDIRRMHKRNESIYDPGSKTEYIQFIDKCGGNNFRFCVQKRHYLLQGH